MVDRVGFAEVHRQMSESIEYGHIKLIILFWTKTARSKLRYQGRATQSKLAPGQTDKTATREFHPIDSIKRSYTPALQCIHKLPGRLQALAHQVRLLPHNRQGILKQPRLVLHRRRCRHGRVQRCRIQFLVGTGYNGMGIGFGRESLGLLT